MPNVSIPPTFQKWTKGTTQVEIKAAKITEMIAALESDFPDLKNKIISNKNSLNRFIKIFVNGEDIAQLSGLETKLQPSDKIKIILALAGG